MVYRRARFGRAVYNAAFRRASLLQLGERIIHSLTRDDEMWINLRAAGHRVYFEPRAVIDHANVSGFFEWVRQRFLTGLMIASRRVQRWSILRRMVYIGGSFLIPVVLISRILPGAWSMAREQENALEDNSSSSTWRIHQDCG